MRLRWTPEIADDLERIYDYLAQHDPERAASTVRRIHKQLQDLRRFPLMGRSTKRSEVRALRIDHLPYICLYTIRPDTIVLLHLFHTSQNRPVDLQ